MRNPLAKKVVEIEPSGIRKFFDVVSEMPDAISLGVGEPDFIDPDLHIFIESGLFLILEINYMDGSSIDYEINLDVKKIQLKPDSL